MRLTGVLCAHDKGRAFKYAWEVAKRKSIPDSHAVSKMNELGIKLTKPEKILAEVFEQCKPKEPLQVLDIIGQKPPEYPLDNRHPLYKSRRCLTFGDSNVLLEGLDQAKVLLNTVQVEDGLPPSLESLDGKMSIPEQNLRVQRSIMSSHVYDAMQVKLPIRKDPNRPSWIFARDYGISVERRFQLIISELLQLCDVAFGHSSVTNRNVIPDAICNVQFEVNGDLIQFENKADFLVTSSKPLSPLTSRDKGNSVNLPDLYPIASTISLTPSNFYYDRSVYPVGKGLLSHPHTVIAYYHPTTVKNLYEEPVTKNQYLARTLTKGFTVAASRAQQLYGVDVKQLPQPVSVQIIQTDGRQYHFGVLQLNTLDLGNSQGEKNIFWMMPDVLDMFSICEYVKGIPTLEDYNPEVFRRILAFYIHGLKQDGA